MRSISYVVLTGLLVMVPGVAIADDWIVSKLRGGAAILVDEKWQPLRRGDVVSDDSAIQTLSGGRATLERGNETIELGPETAVRIDDAATSRFTTVKQYFGSVTVEAEAQNVQHFGVRTPHLAAVVKGTRFTVISDDDTATVSVLRGQVAVKDSDTSQSTLLSVGQSASTPAGGAPLSVSGEGSLPTVYGANGRPVSGADATLENDVGAVAREQALAGGATAQDADRAAKAAEKSVAKDAKAEEKAAEKEAKSGSKEAGGSDKNGSNGGSGSSPGNAAGSDNGSSGGGSGGGNSSNSNGGGNGNSGGNGNGGGKDKG